MAIIPLKKVSVYCMKADLDNVMQALQERGVFHIASVSPDAGLLQQYTEGGRNQETLEKITFALDVIRRYDTFKTPFLSSKPEITPDEFRALKNKSGLIEEAYAAAKETEEKLSSIRLEIQKKQNQTELLMPFAGLDLPLRYLRGTLATDVFLGYLPKESAENTKSQLAGFEEAYAEFLPDAGQNVPVMLIMHKKNTRELKEILKANGFTDARLDGYEQTAKEHIAGLFGQTEDLLREREEILSRTEDVVKYKRELLALEDYYKSVMLRSQALQKAASTRSAALIEGYVKHYEQEKIEQAVSSVSPAYYLEASDPAEDDDELPTAVENNAMVSPFEAVTDMYSVPSARTFDANALMMPFYFIFFGMMVSDAAYGIILSVGAIIFLKLKKPEGTFRKILMILAICGVSTLIWGSGFGGWMGFSLTPWLFDPLKNPLNMLILCISLGIIHLIAGLCMGAYINIRRKRFLAAVFDQGFWILILLSIPFFVLPGAGNAGIGMIAAGAVGIVATAGRHNRGIKKIIGGLSALYGITGYLSDILSYARLFGMALATSVIAMVFNTIAGMMAGSLAGIPFAVIIFLIGHLFNIGINSLGAFVHSARLQYIEFFSKFYEGGGVPFEPLRISLKNMRMVK